MRCVAFNDAAKCIQTKRDTTECKLSRVIRHRVRMQFFVVVVVFVVVIVVVARNPMKSTAYTHSHTAIHCTQIMWCILSNRRRENTHTQTDTQTFTLSRWKRRKFVTFSFRQRKMRKTNKKIKNIFDQRTGEREREGDVYAFCEMVNHISYPCRSQNIFSLPPRSTTSFFPYLCILVCECVLEYNASACRNMNAIVIVRWPSSHPSHVYVLRFVSVYMRFLFVFFVCSFVLHSVQFVCVWFASVCVRVSVCVCERVRESFVINTTILEFNDPFGFACECLCRKCRTAYLNNAKKPVKINKIEMEIKTDEMVPIKKL